MVNAHGRPAGIPWRPGAWLVFLAAVTAVPGCGMLSSPQRVKPGPPPAGIEKVPDALPRAEPLSKYGNPDSYVAMGRRYYVMKSAGGYRERGIASWYGDEFHGRRTSSGEPYDMYQMTAAHKTLPIPTYVEVTNLQTGRRAVVKVNDRGPFKDNRIIDLSYAAARKLGIWAGGTGLVEVRAIDPEHPEPAPPAPVNIAEQTGAPLQFFVQIGAFIERANAERLRERVAQFAQNVRVSPGESNGQAIYRVQIGPLTSVEVSDQIVQSLNRLGVSEHHIVLN